ncbi:MAG: exo-beta-N-acetylmuramidase NamZ domain-containing protein [Flavobacteriales bacterium]
MSSSRLFLAFSILLIVACASKTVTVAAVAEETPLEKKDSAVLSLGIQRTAEYLPLLKGKRVGVVANHTAMIGNKHLVDTLLAMGVKVKYVFAPEHGFRGDADAGAEVKDGIDSKTGLPLFSLYGKNKKPSKVWMDSLDILVFDIQDVGARFYTYISTLHYVMQACAEYNKPLVILDRPNPNGNYVDGPVLQKKYKSFVGMHPIPVVHGMTIGEYAQMVNGEKWLHDSLDLTCPLTVIKMEHYNHNMIYALPQHPSPNLTTMRAIYLYPSLCFFEGTAISVGRGTEFPFETYGHPGYSDKTFSFTPLPIKGKSIDPLLKGELCYGKDLRGMNLDSLRAHGLDLTYLIDAYKNTKTENFFAYAKFFDNLAGSDRLRKQIIEGKSAEEIRASWQEELNAFKKVREKYLMYP